MTRYLLAFVVLLIGVAAGRSDEHRDTRRNRPTPTPTAYTLATPTPLSLQSTADGAAPDGAGFTDTVCVPVVRGDCEAPPLLVLPPGEIPPTETPPGGYP